MRIRARTNARSRISSVRRPEIASDACRHGSGCCARQFCESESSSLSEKADPQGAHLALRWGAEPSSPREGDGSLPIRLRTDSRSRSSSRSRSRSKREKRRSGTGGTGRTESTDPSLGQIRDPGPRAAVAAAAGGRRGTGGTRGTGKTESIGSIASIASGGEGPTPRPGAGAGAGAGERKEDRGRSRPRSREAKRERSRTLSPRELDGSRVEPPQPAHPPRDDDRSFGRAGDDRRRPGRRRMGEGEEPIGGPNQSPTRRRRVHSRRVRSRSPRRSPNTTEGGTRAGTAAAAVAADTTTDDRRPRTTATTAAAIIIIIRRGDHRRSPPRERAAPRHGGRTGSFFGRAADIPRRAFGQSMTHLPRGPENIPGAAPVVIVDEEDPPPVAYGEELGDGRTGVGGSRGVRVEGRECGEGRGPPTWGDRYPASVEGLGEEIADFVEYASPDADELRSRFGGDASAGLRGRVPARPGSEAELPAHQAPDAVARERPGRSDQDGGQV